MQAISKMLILMTNPMGENMHHVTGGSHGLRNSLWPGLDCRQSQQSPALYRMVHAVVLYPHRTSPNTSRLTRSVDITDETQCSRKNIGRRRPRSLRLELHLLSDAQPSFKTVLNQVGSDLEEELSRENAQERLEKYNANVLKSEDGSPVLKIFIRQIANAMSELTMLHHGCA